MSSLFTTAPLLWGFPYIEADIDWCALLLLNDSTAFKSKHWTSNKLWNNPSSYISTIYPVIPPDAKLPLMPSFFIISFL